MELPIKRILITEEEIQTRVAELGEEITKDYAGKNLLVLCVLKGSIIFTADLVRRIKLPLDIECVGAKSYTGTHSSGTVAIEAALPKYLGDCDILIVEDIIDSGLTLAEMSKCINAKKPASLKICTLLYKKSAVKNGIVPDYAGFEIGPEFVVGYGLDYNGKMRNLPHIAVPDV